VHADGRVAIAKLAQQRTNGISILVKQPLTCQTVTVTKDRDETEDIRLLGLERRPDVLDSKLRCSLKPYFRKIQAAVEVRNIVDLDLSVCKFGAAERRAEKLSVVRHEAGFVLGEWRGDRTLWCDIGKKEAFFLIEIF